MTSRLSGKRLALLMDIRMRPGNDKAISVATRVPGHPATDMWSRVKRGIWHEEMRIAQKYGRVRDQERPWPAAAATSRASTSSHRDWPPRIG